MSRDVQPSGTGPSVASSRVILPDDPSTPNPGTRPVYTTANAAAATGDLTITSGPSTGAACPDGSYADLYVLALTKADSFSIASGVLAIGLSDGGTLGFMAGSR